ncbi:MAG: LysR family transcriptional regulator [Pseudomonadota bacterium]|nr:LysR family transcriptional regulator [Pseudomonadota bacterium]
MRDIDLKTLRLFVAVCDCRSMARAAEQEHIEPSAISKRVAQLEDDLGVELLMRGRRGVQATPAGLALLENARSVLFTMDRIVADAASFSGGLQGHVRLIATASAIAEALLDDIASFMREPANENILVDIEERFSRDLVRQLRDGNASLGVCWDNVDFEGLGHRPYRRDRLALAVYAGHSLAGRESVRFEETLEFDHVGLPPQAAVHTMLQRAAARAGRTISYRVIVSNFDAALRVVAANLGVSVVPLEVGRRSAVGVDIQLIPIADAWAERSFAICFRQLEALPPASRHLVAYLEGRAAEATRSASGRTASTAPDAAS